MSKRKTVQQRCDVVLLVDQETGIRGKSGIFKVDHRSVEAQVLWCLRAQYRQVVVVPFDPEMHETVAELRRLKPRLVFNLTEWIDGDRSRDHEIAALLERLQLRYTGSGPEGLRLARDKVKTNRIAARHGVDVPRHFVIHPGARVCNTCVPYPLFVKPAIGDGSDDISKNSVVKNERELRARVRLLRRKQAGPLLCEEYIPGCDLFIALLGNAPQVLHPMEMVVRRRGAGAPQFSSRRVKQDVRYQKFWKIGYRKALLPAAVLRKIRRSSRKIFHALKLRGYARLDFRLTPEHRLVFLEANPNPDLARDGFCTNGCFVGVKYADVIRCITCETKKYN